MPFPTPMALAIFFTTWFIVLFAVLPFGVHSQSETGDVVEGSDPGAPVAPKLWWKALWTTIVTIIVFGLIVLITKLAS